MPFMPSNFIPPQRPPTGIEHTDSFDGSSMGRGQVSPFQPGGTNSTLGGTGQSIQQMLAYIQQQQGQGVYTPNNGPQGVPSQGWDAWQGYQPAPRVSTSYNPNGTDIGNAGMVTDTLPPRGMLTTPNPGGTNQSWSGEGQNGDPWTANMSSTPAPEGYNPAANSRGVVAGGSPYGTQTADMRMGTGVGANTVGYGGLTMNDLRGFKNDPTSATGTPWENFQQGGLEGTGSPLGFGYGRALESWKTNGAYSGQGPGYGRAMTALRQSGDAMHMYGPRAGMTDNQYAAANPRPVHDAINGRQNASILGGTGATLQDLVRRGRG
jgi:hypothetical protein